MCGLHGHLGPEWYVLFWSLPRYKVAGVEADLPGHGSGIVVATGTDTEFGVIFSMMQDVSYPFHLDPGGAKADTPGGRKTDAAANGNG